MSNTEVPIYYLINSIDTMRGGLTRNVLTRAKLLSEKLGQPIHMLSFNFNPDYDQIRNDLKALKIINDHIVIHNLYEYLAPEHETSVGVDEIRHSIEEKGLTVDKDGEKNGYRLYKNGLYIKYKSFSNDGKLVFIDYFNENRYRTHREHFDAKGRLRRIVYMDFVLNKPRQKQFFDESGHCFLSIWYNPENGKSTKVNWFNEDSGLFKVFDSEHELKKYWLEKFTVHQTNAIFQADARNTAELLFSIKNPHITKVMMLHSNHIDVPAVYGSPLMKGHEKTLKKASEADALVFITKEQKEDVARQFGPRTTYHTIPHYTKKADTDKVPDREPFTAVAVARYVLVKKLDHVIRAFRTVVKHIPQAKLELWGFGPEADNLKKLINELNLDSNVCLKGFTHNTARVFQRAAFSVFSSETEGFGLVIAESMAAGAPVISYDINYGPREMITHNVDGMLIQPNDIDALSEAMVTLFTDPDKREAMSVESRKIVHKLNEEVYAQSWLNVYKLASEQRHLRIKLNQPSCTLTNLEWMDTEAGKMHLEGIITFYQETSRYKDWLRLSLYIRKRDQLIDCYFPLKIEWVDDSTARFNGELTLSQFRDGSWMGKGIWDIYVSCAARNDHQFVRLSGNKEEHFPAMSTYVLSDDNTTILPYYTKYGNVSFDVGQQKHKKQMAHKNNSNMQNRIIRKLKRIVSLNGWISFSF